MGGINVKHSLLFPIYIPLRMVTEIAREVVIESQEEAVKTTNV